MKVLLDTNIIIHRETHRIVRDDIGVLFNWIDKLHYDKYLHPNTIKEIEKYKDPDVVNAFTVKMGAYNIIRALPKLAPEVIGISDQVDTTDNDVIDTEILNVQFLGITDLFITEDKKLRYKAKLLGMNDSVLSIEQFLERVSIEHPKLVDYKVLEVQKRLFGEIDLDDSFFDSFRDDYIGFNKWYRKKNDEFAYVCLVDNKVLAFLYIKIEDQNESYMNISPPFWEKNRLKIGTFKVELNGFKLGERFLKIIFDNAIQQNVDEIYVTIFNKSLEQKRLINLIEKFGFSYHGIKTTSSGEEYVYLRTLDKSNYNSRIPKHNYPFIKKDARTFLVSVYPKYHTDLFPDSILRTESPIDFIENEPFRNAISKMFISRSIFRDLHTGDNIIFYRTGGYYKSVISTIGVVENVYTNISSFADFMKICGNRSVFDQEGLREFWDYRSSSKPFVVNFLYTYSFPKRINMEKLINLGIIRDISFAPRGFEMITQSDFNKIIEETQTNASVIID